jgi:hypothetical protein
VIEVFPPKPKLVTKWVYENTCQSCQHVLKYEQSDVVKGQTTECDRGCCVFNHYYIVCPKCNKSVGHDPMWTRAKQITIDPDAQIQRLSKRADDETF